MEALLLAPPEARYVRAFSTHEYLGLGYLAAFLEKHGYTVEVHNCNCRSAFPTETALWRAVEAKPAIVGITVPTLPNLPGAVHLVQKLRETGYRGHVTLGGHVPTFQYVELLETLHGVDSIVRGEGEETLLELVSCCVASRDWRGVRGLAYRSGGKIVCTPPRVLIDNLDSLPFPRRALSQVKEKLATGIAEVSSSRGCYGNCTFCSIFSFYELSPGRRFRYRSAENVVDELVWLVKTYGVRNIIFVDDNFLGTGQLGKRRVVRIAQLILEKQLELSLNISCRADDIDPDVFALLKEAGLSRVFVGVESGVDTALVRYRKHITVDENLRALQILTSLDIAWDMGFMIYDPDTTFEELEENVRFLRRKRLYQFKAATLLLNGMVVFPGTPVETQLRREKRLVRDSRAALEFMGARDDAADYDQALRFINQTYGLSDPRAQRMREMIDFAYEDLTPIYDVIWPLIADWEKWIMRAIKICGVDADHIIGELGAEGDAYRALLHWNRGMGVLVMNLLEDMVELVRDEQGLQSFQKIFRKRVGHFLERGHPEGLSGAVRSTEQFLYRDLIQLGIDHQTWLIPGATSFQSVPGALGQPLTTTVS